MGASQLEGVGDTSKLPTLHLEKGVGCVGSTRPVLQ